MICTICAAEDDANHAKAKAAYHAAGAGRLLAALEQHKADDPLAQQIADLILATSAPKSEAAELARDVISLVRAFDEETARKREALEDHQAQNNEGRGHAY